MYIPIQCIPTRNVMKYLLLTKYKYNIYYLYTYHTELKMPWNIIRDMYV